MAKAELKNLVNKRVEIIGGRFKVGYRGTVVKFFKSNLLPSGGVLIDLDDGTQCYILKVKYLKEI